MDAVPDAPSKPLFDELKWHQEACASGSFFEKIMKRYLIFFTNKLLTN